MCYFKFQWHWRDCFQVGESLLIIDASVMHVREFKHYWGRYKNEMLQEIKQKMSSFQINFSIAFFSVAITASIALGR